jgi:hypothetical protein
MMPDDFNTAPLDPIDTEWTDICFAVFSGPASWDDWIALGKENNG